MRFRGVRKSIYVIVSQILLAVLFVVLSVKTQQVYAWEDDDYSHDKARRAVEDGHALPVTQMILHLRSHTSDDIVALEYEYEFGRWVYEFKVVDKQGRLRRVHMDAATGKFLNEQD
jgi:uncharacterized membrane protein YkoI